MVLLVFLGCDDTAVSEDGDDLVQQAVSLGGQEGCKIGHGHAPKCTLPVHAFHLAHQDLQQNKIPRVVMSYLVAGDTEDE